jgi:hypothetical protein
VESHLRVLADQLFFTIEKNGDRFTLRRTADVSEPVLRKVIWASDEGRRTASCMETARVTVGDDNPITHVYRSVSPVRVGVFQSAKPIETRDFGGAIPSCPI